MTKIRTSVIAKSFAAILPLLTIVALSSAVFAMEPERDPGRFDLSRPDILLTRIAWQDRTGPDAARQRLHATTIDALERSYGRHGEVARSNLLNSQAARYFTRVLTGRRGR